MTPALLGISALVPAALLLWYLCSRDLHPEPPGVVLRTFFLGVLISLPVVPLAQALDRLGAGALGRWPHALASAFLGAAIPEEAFKFLVLRLWVWRQRDFDEPMDGIVYGAAASLGFAALENLLYVSGRGGGFGVAALRAATAVPGHAMTGVVMGYFVGRARFAAHGRLRLLATGLFAAVLLHGAYDAALMTESAWSFLALPVLALEVLWGRGLIARMRGEQLLVPPVKVIEVLEHAPLALAPLALPRHRRTVWAGCKLVLGGLGASFSALVVVGCAREAEVGGALVSLVVTLGFVWIFRSGLRGPFAVPETPGGD